MRNLLFRLILCEKQVPASGSSCMRQDSELEVSRHQRYDLMSRVSSNLIFPLAAKLASSVPESLRSQASKRPNHHGHSARSHSERYRDIDSQHRAVPGRNIGGWARGLYTIDGWGSGRVFFGGFPSLTAFDCLHCSFSGVRSVEFTSAIRGGDSRRYRPDGRRAETSFGDPAVGGRHHLNQRYPV